MTTAPGPGTTPAPGSVPSADATQPAARGSQSSRVALAPERFYWALVPSLPSRMTVEAMRYAFEPWLPVPLEEVEMRFARIAVGGSILCCGIDNDRLAEHIDAHGGDGVASLRPARLPEVILRRLPSVPSTAFPAPGASPEHPSASPASPEAALRLPGIDLAAVLARLEFRTGAFEQPAARRARRRRLTLFAASLALFAALLGVGWLREARGARFEAARAWTAADLLAADALRAASLPSAASPAGAHPEAGAGVGPRLRLEAAVREMSRTRDRSAAALLPEDRSRTLIELLAHWPEDVPARLEQALADQTSLTLRWQARDAGDAERLALALDRALPGWIEGSRSGAATRESFTSTLILRRDPARALSQGTGMVADEGSVR